MFRCRRSAPSTFLDGPATGVASHNHGCFLAAVADGANLAHFVGQRQQGGRPRKQLPLEIHAQPVTHDRNAQIIDGARQLPDLIGAQKLGFVDEDAGARTGIKSCGYFLEQVFSLAESVRRLTNTDTRCNAPVASTVIKLRRHQIR